MPRASMPPALRLLVTCEHASNAVPALFLNLFSSPSAQAALASHRGWDPGAADAARAFSRRSRAPCLLGSCTRLLVDLNRSPSGPGLWSPFSRHLPPAKKSAVVRSFHLPFRVAARDAIDRMLSASRGPAFHLSVHSFVPELDGLVRDAEIGLLYDPLRPLEALWADAWESALRRFAPSWRVRRNFPYLGVDDGHAADLRARLAPDRYSGLELEINQSLLLDPSRRAASIDVLARCLSASLASPFPAFSLPRRR